MYYIDYKVELSMLYWIKLELDVLYWIKVELAIHLNQACYIRYRVELDWL